MILVFYKLLSYPNNYKNEMVSVCLSIYGSIKQTLLYRFQLNFAQQWPILYTWKLHRTIAFRYLYALQDGGLYGDVTKCQLGRF